MCGIKDLDSERCFSSIRRVVFPFIGKLGTFGIIGKVINIMALGGLSKNTPLARGSLSEGGGYASPDMRQD